MARPKRGGRAKAKAASKDDEAAAAAAENAVKDEEEEPTGTRRSKRAKVESPPPAKAKPSKSKNAETKEEEDDAPSKSTATTKKSAATNKKRAASNDADADADTEKAEPKQGKKARKASAASSKDEDEAAIAIASIAKKQEESDKAAPQDDEKPAAKAKSKDSDKKDDEPASSDGKPPAQTNEGKTMKAQEKFDESWSEMMKQLSEYKKENGNTEVPMVSNQDEKYYELSKWVGKVRTQMKNYEQDEKQQKDSTAKSSTEKSSDAKKDDKDAKSSKEEEKDGKSEKDASKPAPKYNRAKTSSKSLLDESKVKELHDLGFTFKYKRGMKRKTPEEEANDFDTLCSLLGEYKVTGKSIKSHTKLQGWIAKQRKHYEEFKNNRTSSLTEERVKRLEDAGMNWNPKQTQTWDERAKAWKEYKDKNGSDPKRYSEDGLGKWVTEQRSKYKRYNLGQPTNLTSEQIETLTGWGFSFAPAITQPTNKAAPASWEERFKELLKWKEEHGHCMVPQHFPILGQWVHGQRSHYRKFQNGNKTNMTQEKIDKLESIGFTFYTGKGGGVRTPESVLRRLSKEERKKKEGDKEPEKTKKAAAKTSPKKKKPAAKSKKSKGAEPKETKKEPDPLSGAVLV